MRAGPQYHFVSDAWGDFMNIRKVLLTAGAVSVLLGLLVVSSASGRGFAVDNQSIRAAFSEVIFREPGGASTNCHVTLEGSLHSSTIAKVLGTLIGSVTRATLGRCEVGTATILTEALPWNIRYSGFQGRLPEITSLIVHVPGFAVRSRLSNGITCLSTSEANEPVIGRLHFDANPSHHVRVGTSGGIRTGPECLGIRGELSTEQASRYLLLLGTAFPISITLI